jgi:hypothetical protein
MRHFSLMRFLVVASFAISSPETQVNALAAATNQARRSTQLHSARMPTEEGLSSSRRAALATVFGASLAFVTQQQPANALDMDAFMNSELQSDAKNCDPKKDRKCAPEMTKDEALCKYGQSGDARGEACKRFKASGGALSKPGAAGKSPGGAYAM